MRDKIHLAQYEINAVNFDPSAKAVKRPDTAMRLTAAHAAWAQQKVQASRDGLVNGANTVIAPEPLVAIREGQAAARDAYEDVSHAHKPTG